MNVSRRAVIKNLLLVSVGATLIPSCMQEKSKASLLLHNIEVSGEDEKLLAELGETLIPVSDTPGAKDVYTHLFALKMVDDCTTKADQDQFLKGMKSFNDLSQKRFKKSFVAATPAERQSLLTAIEAKTDIPEDVLAFYKMAKRLTIQGYVTSKYFMGEVQHYQLIPGQFNGCAPVKSSNQKAYKV